jgi:hypothetical protein
VQLLTTLLVVALSPVLAAAPAAPVRGPEPAPEKPRPEQPPSEEQEEPREAPPPSVGRVVLRADGPQEHGPSFGEAPEPPLAPDRPPALRARRLAAASPQRPPVLEAPRADLRAGFVALPPPVA